LEPDELLGEESDEPDVDEEPDDDELEPDPEDAELDEDFASDVEPAFAPAFERESVR
jgi:hypothetical protein